jgi:hypothetical protein
MGCEESKFEDRCIASAQHHTAWVPYSFFESGADWENEGKPPFALLILNQKISNKKLFTALWKNC